MAEALSTKFSDPSAGFTIERNFRGPPVAFSGEGSSRHGIAKANVLYLT